MAKDEFGGVSNISGEVYFADEKYLSTDVGLDRDVMFDDVAHNKALGLNELLGDNAVDAGLPINSGKLIIIAAAGDIEGERMLALNKELAGYVERCEEVCTIVAGAGHYALPPEGTAEKDIDLSKFVNPKYVHAAISNFSIGNSHTKAFKNPRSDIKYLMASHCSSEELSGNGSTIQHLMDSDIVPNENIFLYDALLDEDQIAEVGQSLVGTGTGAPPAAVAVVAALRHQKELKNIFSALDVDALDVKAFGFDGTSDILHGKSSEMPDDYLNRHEVIVNVDGKDYAKVPKAYYDQMDQIADMFTWYKGMLGNFQVDGEDSLSAAIFNTPNGKPRTDYQIMKSFSEPKGNVPEA